MIQLLQRLISDGSNLISAREQDVSMSHFEHEHHQGLINNNKKSGAVGVIMTAHHLNDSEETILLKLLRGVHISRLQGMEAVSSTSSSQNRVLFARPLIQIRKQEIKEYLVVNQFRWREDSSNEEPKYLRNRIRNELVPLLEDLVGGKDNLQVNQEIMIFVELFIKSFI